LIFSLPENAKPGIMLSGGADSTLLLWMLLKNNINPLPFVVNRRNGSITNTKCVIDWINNYYNISYPYPTMVGNPSSLTHDQQVKSGLREVFKKEFATHVYLGTIKPPPVDFPKNPPDQTLKNKNKNIITPFLLKNKKDIYKLYKTNNILDLLKITHSCEIYDDKHCNKCFSCYERLWGMNEL